MKEQWKEINGYDGYSVSNTGKIKSFRRKSYKENGLTLTPETSYKGYEQVSLYKDGKKHQKLVHRLVAEAFIPNPENKPEVNHKDTDKSNNKVSNLEWSTSSENTIHAYKNGLYDNLKESLSISGPNRHPPVRVVETGKIYRSQRELSNELNLCEQSVSRCLKGGSKSTKGYHFEYVKED